MRPVIYTSYLQQPGVVAPPLRTLPGNMTFVVRTAGAPEAILPAIRRAVADIDAEHPLAGAGPVRQHLDAAMRQFRYFVFLVTLLACTAGLLAAIGVYGTIAYLAGQRTREIGIRRALGATRWQIARLVVRGTAGSIGAGIVAGLAGALVAGHAIRAELWGIAPTDAATYGAAAFALSAVAAAACLVPARAAASVKPTDAIRCE